MVRPSALAVSRLMAADFRGLFDRKVGRLLALENPAGVAAAPVRARAAEQALQACRAIELPPTASIALSATRVTVRPAIAEIAISLSQFASLSAGLCRNLDPLQALAMSADNRRS